MAGAGKTKTGARSNTRGKTRDLPTRIGELERAARRNPGNEATRLALGLAWLEAGECDRAIDILSRIAKSSPLAKEAAKATARARAIAAEPRAPANYVRHLFDQFSKSYDRRMVAELSYRAPGILRALGDLLSIGHGRKLKILDLGCGTGLSGAAFKDLAARLDGVDLSPGMIAIARKRGIYDTLECADLLAALGRKGPVYDLILAADTLVYLGELEAVFRLVAKRLAIGGLFLFTVEKKTGRGYEWGDKRRYRHSKAYVRALAGMAALEIMGLIECSPRTDAGRPIKGLAVALQRFKL